MDQKLVYPNIFPSLDLFYSSVILPNQAHEAYIYS